MRIERTTVTIVCDQPATAEADGDHRADLTVDEVVWLAENGKVTVMTTTIELDEL